MEDHELRSSIETRDESGNSRFKCKPQSRGGVLVVLRSTGLSSSCNNLSYVYAAPTIVPLAAFLGAIFPAAFAFLFFEASLFDLTASFRLESFAA